MYDVFWLLNNNKKSTADAFKGYKLTVKGAANVFRGNFD